VLAAYFPIQTVKFMIEALVKMVVVNTLKNLLMRIVIFFKWWINRIKLELGKFS